MANVFGENKNYFESVTDWTAVYVAWYDAQLVKRLEEKKSTCSAFRCSKPGKFTRLVNQLGQLPGPFGFRDYDTIHCKSFCGVHDPVTQKEKRDAKYAEEKRVRDAKNARENAMRARAALVQSAVGHLTDAQLTALANKKNALLDMLSGGEVVND